MSEKERKILENLADVVKTLPENKKQYLLGFAEGVASMAAPKQEQQTTEEKETEDAE